ncbi:nucleoid occlusion protein [Clostridium oryzae]|uniref:Nucleoid occlusion protein n=1 Tax=Clostridium oryzae TaxID=1450648 RepID=A0A1V4IG87_9CLOT|nr:nucleoid occlusion protein [Clostridium oryzae]OPJ58675.1 nucleoid occlusion protein [Clostridium oryzae]
MQKEIIYVSPNKIVPNLYQPRKSFDEDSIEELAQSIKHYGIIQPLSVRKLGNDSYELVAGERRLRAAKKIELEEVPIILVDVNDKESASIALLENLQREDLNFLEEAEAYYNLIKEHGYTQEKLAEYIGKKQSTIANKLRLLKLSDSIRKRILDNRLTERHARAFLKISDDKVQQDVLDVVIKKGLNVKQTEDFIESVLIKNEKEKFKKRVKTSFNTRVYLNTIKQIFDKYGVGAKYKTEESDRDVRVTIIIPKK